MAVIRPANNIRLPAITVSGSSEQALTGLDWDGSGTVRRMLVFTSPPPIYPLTFLHKAFPRNQVNTRADGNRYSTGFFWGNNGSFTWNGGAAGTYYGAHPYPIPAPTGNGKFEISIYSADFVERDDGSEPFVTFDRWYSHGFVATRLSASDTHHKLFVDLPSVATADTITVDITGDSNWAATDPPSPCICIGQAPNVGGVSWGGYPGWEEYNGILRGLQIHVGGLSQAQVLTLEACETDAEVLAACISLGIDPPWHLCMNPTPTDVTDKSGNGHHPSWDGAARPTLWTGP